MALLLLDARAKSRLFALPESMRYPKGSAWMHGPGTGDLLSVAHHPRIRHCREKESPFRRQWNSASQGGSVVPVTVLALAGKAIPRGAQFWGRLGLGCLTISLWPGSDAPYHRACGSRPWRQPFAPLPATLEFFACSCLTPLAPKLAQLVTGDLREPKFVPMFHLVASNISLPHYS